MVVISLGVTNGLRSTIILARALEIQLFSEFILPLPAGNPFREAILSSRLIIPAVIVR